MVGGDKDGDGAEGVRYSWMVGEGVVLSKKDGEGLSIIGEGGSGERGSVCGRSMGEEGA